MKGNIHYVVNEGRLVFATDSEELAEGYADGRSQEDLEDTVDEYGRDMDDLTPEELAEMTFINGFDGGYYYTDTVYVDDEYDLDDTFTSSQGDEFTFSELKDAYKDSDEIYSYGYEDLDNDEE